MGELKKLFGWFSHAVEIEESFDYRQDVTFKLVAIHFSKKHGHDICVLQMLGRNVFTELDPRQIVATPEILNSLSPSDTIEVGRLIERLEAEMEQGCYRLLEVALENSDQPDKFIATKIGIAECKVFSLNDINVNSSLLKKLKPEEAFYLGTHKATLDFLSEMKAIKELQSATQKSAIKKLFSIIK